MADKRVFHEVITNPPPCLLMRTPYRTGGVTCAHTAVVQTREGSTRTYVVRKELVAELKSRERRWLNKVLMVNSTATVSSPSASCSYRCRDWPKQLAIVLDYGLEGWFSWRGKSWEVYSADAPLAMRALLEGVCAPLCDPCTT
eukprot:1189689-Prorocentrum_minimum.AAC.1